MGHTKNNAVTFDYFFFKKKITYFISLFSVVSQDYVTETNNEYIILGNDALMKCEVPSFVSDLVQVHSWIDNENNEFYLKDGFRSKRVGGRAGVFMFFFKFQSHDRRTHKLLLTLTQMRFDK